MNAIAMTKVSNFFLGICELINIFSQATVRDPVLLFIILINLCGQFEYNKPKLLTTKCLVPPLAWKL